MDLTAQEKYVLAMLRELRPFEELRITKDKTGRPNDYFVTRTQKLVIDTANVHKSEYALCGAGAGMV